MILFFFILIIAPFIWKYFNTGEVQGDLSNPVELVAIILYYSLIYVIVLYVI